MTYFPDMSSYTYNPNEILEGSVNIGWLSPAHNFQKSIPSQEFLEKLLKFCAYSYSLARGVHYCELCSKYNEDSFEVAYNGKSITLGAAEIRAIGINQVIYCAPNLIHHYVRDHNYAPPAEFVEAILKGPLPNSAEHKELFDNREWPSRPTTHLRRLFL